MCGRFAIDIEKPIFVKRFNVLQMEIQLKPNYNVAPGEFLPTVIRKSPNKAVLMKWGLIPHWSREPKTKFSTINARMETIESSPVYRMPFYKQRCLIPAIGFYEWAKVSDGTKSPYFFNLKNQSMFVFAGLWDVWKDVEGKEFPSCTIITCPANSIVGKIHPRMPVILEEADEDLWLSDSQDNYQLISLLKPYAEGAMEGYRVSTRVNNPRNIDKEVIEKYSEK